MVNPYPGPRHGCYECEPHNFHKHHHISIIIFSVYSSVPPSLIIEPESGVLEIPVGGRAHMACHATGVPTPIITWKCKVFNSYFSKYFFFNFLGTPRIRV